MPSIPQPILTLLFIASFVAGTFFQLRPIEKDSYFKILDDATTRKVSLRTRDSNPVTTSDIGATTAIPAPQLPAVATDGAAFDARCSSKLDALDRTWDLRRDARLRATEGRTVPYKPNPNWQSTGVFDFYEPEAVCLDDERFGSISTERYSSFGDGPKFVCGIDRIVEKAKANKDCLIYSVGSNNEIDFEVAVTSTMGAGNCEVHTFDPTVRPDTFVGNDYATFHDWGFGEDGVKKDVNHGQRGHFNFTEMSLVTAMKKLDHYGKRKIDIFKIDCEGCEFVAMTEAFQAISRGEIQVDQVQIEIHAPRDGYFPLIKRMMEAADAANMRVFHKEGNSWGCSGWKCVEYAFVSKEFLRKANGHYMCS